jgi:hypothetical protein
LLISENTHIFWEEIHKRGLNPRVPQAPSLCQRSGDDYE